MPVELEIVLFSAVVPAITAALVAILLQRLPKPWAGSSLAVAAAVGCGVGYALLPDWAPLLPQRHWQWIHYLTLPAAMAGSLLTLGRVPRWGKAAVLLALGLIAAWLVVPTWDTLQPSRMVLLPALVCYCLLLSWLLILLPAQLRGRHFCVLLGATATATTLLIAIEVSLMLGQASGIAAASLMGCCLGAWYLRSDIAAATVALVPVFAIACGSFAFAAAIEPAEPAWILLLAPAAPLTLWLFAWGPFSRLQGVTVLVVQTLVVALILFAIGGWLLLRSEPADEWSAASQPASEAISQPTILAARPCPSL